MAVKILADVGLASQLPINSKFNPRLQLKPTFFFDPASIKQQTSAEYWASNYGRSQGTNHKGTPTFRANLPMSNLYLDDIDVRLEGGRAYKVFNMDDMTYFDVREDQMLQAIMKYGIQPGGKIGGEWIFALNHTQMKCYLVDGSEYKQALLDNAISSKVGAKRTSKFVVGDYYSDKPGISTFIYLGRYPMVYFDTVLKKHNFSSKEKYNWFFYKEANAIVKLSTVYDCLVPKSEPNNDLKQLVIDSDLINKISKHGESVDAFGSCGYNWYPNMNYNNSKIVWTEYRDHESFIADMFLNGEKQVLDNLPK